MAIYGYIADRLGYSIKRLKSPMIPGILEKHVPALEIVEQVIDCLNQAEGARYIPKDATLDSEVLILEALQALERLDETWIAS